MIKNGVGGGGEEGEEEEKEGEKIKTLQWFKLSTCSKSSFLALFCLMPTVWGVARPKYPHGSQESPLKI